MQVPQNPYGIHIQPPALKQAIGDGLPPILPEWAQFLPGADVLTEVLVSLAVLGTGGLSVAAIRALLRRREARRKERELAEAEGQQEDHAETLRKEVERRINNLIREDEIGWGRTLENETRVIFDDSSWGYCSGRTIHIPSGRDFRTGVLPALHEFIGQNTVTVSRRFLLGKHRTILDLFHTDHVITVARIEEVCGALGVGNLRPANLDHKLYGRIHSIGDQKLGRWLLLEAKDLDISLAGADFSTPRARAARRRLEETLGQLADGRDGTKRGRDGRRNWEVTRFRIVRFCEEDQPKIDDIRRAVEPALADGFKAYVSYWAPEDRDSVQEGLALSPLSVHCRDVWQERTEGFRKMRLSFVPDKAGPLPTAA